MPAMSSKNQPHFEQLANSGASRRVVGSAHVVTHELRCGSDVPAPFAVAIADRPRIDDQRFPLPCENRVELGGEPIQRSAQRRAPMHRTSRVGRGHPAGTVGPPSLDTVRTAPRRWGDQPHLLLGGMARQHGSVVLHANVVTGFERVQQPGQGDLAKTVVVSVRLAVRRDGDHQAAFPRPIGRQQPIRPAARIVQQSSKSDCLGNRTIVDAHRDFATARRSNLRRPAVRWDGVDLMRGQDREPNPGHGQDIERLLVHRRLRQPHALRLTTEAAPEIRDAPADFRFFVAA